MNLEKFLSSLSNMEKSRDKNRFLNYTLDYFKVLLDKFSTSSKALNISIVGTNGKGSTTEILKELILKNNLTELVGTYTSPHLISEFERIKINHKNISKKFFEDFLNSKNFNEIETLKKLSYFEFFTLIAKNYFSENQTEINLYEAGLGGRLDATKLMNSEIIVLTKIGLDHKEILGDTKEKILIEKLGIITKNTKKIFYFEKDFPLKKIIEEKILEFNLESYFFETIEKLDYISFNTEYAKFILENLFNKKIETKKIQISGRMEILKNNPLVIYDVSHNPEGVSELLRSLKLSFLSFNSFDVVLAVLKDKNVFSILEILNNDSRIKKIYQIIGETWNEENISSKKINYISEKDLEKIFQSNENILILGSFRIYEKVKKIV